MLTPSPVCPLIVGVPGQKLDEETTQIFKELNPVGYILMGHNCQSAEQVEALCAELNALSSTHTPFIFIDQEGGRVRRIKWFEGINLTPHIIGQIYARSPQVGIEVATLNAYVTAARLSKLGVTVNCFPLGDLAVAGASDVIGDRAYSSNPIHVTALCGAAISGSMSGGVWPVIKHAPGHGRAQVDSHLGLPTVNASKSELMSKDFKPFIINNLCPFMMTAHIAYPELGGTLPATQSQAIIGMLKHEFGVKSILVSDDIGMEALQGNLVERATKTLEAGVHLVLYCGTQPTGEMFPNYLEQLKWLVGKFTLSEETRQKIKNLPKKEIPNDKALQDASERLALVLQNV